MGRLCIDRRALAKRTGLILPEDLTLSSWQRIGEEIRVISDASGWWLGDWLVFGERKYPERYKRAVEGTALDYQTLRNYAWVARKFEAGRRHDGLSIQHHAEVAALPADRQDYWLARAERFGWSRNALRKELRAERSRGADGTQECELLVTVKLVPEQRSRWAAAASMSSRNLTDWMADALDRAAYAALNESVTGFPSAS